MAPAANFWLKCIRFDKVCLKKSCLAAFLSDLFIFEFYFEYILGNLKRCQRHIFVLILVILRGRSQITFAKRGEEVGKM